jgi:hypothetical protein
MFRMKVVDKNGLILCQICFFCDSVFDVNKVKRCFKSKEYVSALFHCTYISRLLCIASDSSGRGCPAQY